MDVPVAEHRAFIFSTNGQQSGQRARTLCQFVSILERTPVTLLEGYVRRGDFSRWIGHVFGDYPLAAELRALEERHRGGVSPDTLPEIVAAIRGRYDLVPADQAPVAQ